MVSGARTWGPGTMALPLFEGTDLAHLFFTRADPASLPHLFPPEAPPPPGQCGGSPSTCQRCRGPLRAASGPCPCPLGSLSPCPQSCLCGFPEPSSSQGREAGNLTPDMVRAMRAAVGGRGPSTCPGWWSGRRDGDCSQCASRTMHRWRVSPQLLTAACAALTRAGLQL